MKKIESCFYAGLHSSFKEARENAEDWFYKETPRHTQDEVEVIARVYTESGICRKVYRARASYKGIRRIY